MGTKPRKPIIQNEVESISYKRSFLIGCILGDAFSRRRDLVSGQLRAELTISHSGHQKDLVEWKAQKVYEMFGIKPNIAVHTYNGYENARFSFTKKGRLRVIHSWFHRDKNGKKRITDKIRFMDHPIGLAMLLCDDGSVRKRKQMRKDGSIHYLPPSITIATHCFAPGQVEKLLAHIEKLCGAKGYINPERRWRSGKRVEYARVNFNGTETQKMWDYVKSYIPQVPSMMKKFAFIIERYGIDEIGLRETVHQ